MEHRTHIVSFFLIFVAPITFLQASDLINTQIPLSSIAGYQDPDKVTDACEKARRNASNYQNYAAYWITQVEKQNTRIVDKNGLINQYMNLNSNLTKERDTFYRNAANCTAQIQPQATTNAELVAENKRLFDLMTNQAASLKSLADNNTAVTNSLSQDKGIISALSADNSELKKKVAELSQANTTVHNMMNENTQLKAQIAALNAQISTMQSELAHNSSGGGSQAGGNSGGSGGSGGSGYNNMTDSSPTLSSSPKGPGKPYH